MRPAGFLEGLTGPLPAMLDALGDPAILHFGHLSEDGEDQLPHAPPDGAKGVNVDGDPVVDQLPDSGLNV